MKRREIKSHQVEVHMESKVQCEAYIQSGFLIQLDLGTTCTSSVITFAPVCFMM